MHCEFQHRNDIAIVTVAVVYFLRVHLMIVIQNHLEGVEEERDGGRKGERGGRGEGRESVGES